MKINSQLLKLYLLLLLAVMMISSTHAGISPATPAVIGHLPVVSNVTITPTAPKAGDTVTAAWTYQDRDNDAQSGTSIAWFLAGSAVAGAVGNSFTLPVDAAGKVLQVRIMPRSAAPADPAQGQPVITAGITIAANQPSPSDFGFTKPANIKMQWQKANSYCIGLSPQARLPTRKELQDLFVNSTSATAADGAQTNFEMCDIHGWPLIGGRCGGGSSIYWTREMAAIGEPYIVNMSNGYTSSQTIGPINLYQVTCVR